MASKGMTICFDPQVYAALQLKASYSHRSVSEIVNEAVEAALAEDQEDLAAIDDRAAEPVLTYDELLDDLAK